jgi:hypothetical protein
MDISCQLQAIVALPWENTLDTNWLGGYVGPRTGTSSVAIERISVLAGNKNPVVELIFSMPLVAHSRPRPLIQFRNHFSQTAGLLGRVISQRPLPKHRTVQAQNKCIHTPTSISLVGFETTNPASVQTKTVHALDSAATVSGITSSYRE